MSQPNGKRKRRFGDNIVLLYVDTLAYHLTELYPRLFSTKYPTYCWMVAVPSSAIALSWWSIRIQKTWALAVPVLTVSAYLVIHLWPVISVSYVHAKAWAEHRLEANPAMQQWSE